MKCSLPLHIGSKVTIENYNTFLHNYGSRGYKFWFHLSDDSNTGEVYIVDMASSVHENIVFRLQKFFEVPNNGVVDNPLIVVAGQTRKRIYSSFLLLLNSQYSHNLFI